MRAIVIANHHPRLRLDRRAVTRAMRTLDAHHAALATRDSVLDNDGELSLVFMTDRALAELHAGFLDDPTLTDVITFAGNPALGTAGEICVSVDAAIRHVTGGPKSGSTTLAAEPKRTQRIDPREFTRELTLYLVHGWLHLAGYDDLQPAKKRRMRRAEKKAMALLEHERAIPRFNRV